MNDIRVCYMLYTNRDIQIICLNLGAKVILACRNVEKAKLALEDIKNNPFPR